ncbi:MAG: hypothetical protein RL077_4380 [Verrucomicrobiota bacterium]|jgi:HEPN domain-containing protein
MSRPEQAALFLRKARQDLVAAEAPAATAGVSDEIVGFHCQQAAEKLLKTWLSQHAQPFPRTHNLLTRPRSIRRKIGTNLNPACPQQPTDLSPARIHYRDTGAQRKPLNPETAVG